MTAPRPTFRPITSPLDVDDGALARLNEQLGVPALVKSAPEQPPVRQDAAQDSVEREARLSPARGAADTPAAKKTATPTPGPVEKLSVELPGYLTDAIKRHAAQNRTSVRYIVMRGLAALGFAIATADMAPDARRRPHKPAKR